jgi:hypothetical protein
MLDAEQSEKVKAFRSKVGDQGGLYAEYSGLDDFKKKLRRNLIRAIKDKYRSKIGEQQLEDTRHQVNQNMLEAELRHALKAFKGQPDVFVEPKLSTSTDFKDEENLLNEVIEDPTHLVIFAPPQFGLTCLSLHMRLEAFKNGKFWVYLDAEHVKTRNVEKAIEKELVTFEKTSEEIQCVILDGWDPANADHKNLILHIRSEYKETRVIVTMCPGGLQPSSPDVDNLLDGFRTLHLQAMGRNSMRNLIDSYLPDEREEVKEKLLGEVATHLKAINIHRTPLNCLTLLRVNGSDYNEKLLNKTKLMKAIMFVLFMDMDSFSYQGNRPDVDEVTVVLGKFCKELVINRSLSFRIVDFKKRLQEICENDLISLDLEAMIQVLVDNSILLKYGNQYEFKHRYWVFYFAAVCMFHDDEFKKFIIEDQKYSTHPDIIDFYTGIDGRREGMIQVLMNDLNELIVKVEDKIGIKDDYNPLSRFLWNPSDEYIELARREIVEKVETSNLPCEIKDQYADKSYDSNEPYYQGINNFLVEYQVQKLRGTIAAASRALRNSTFIKPELKMEMAKAITKGWEEISRVTFWISPLLARDGRASHDGLTFVLEGDFSDDPEQRFKQILIANPLNVIKMVKDDLKSNKLGMVLFKQLNETKSLLQKHLIVSFIAESRPDGWYDVIFEHLNMLNPRSYYLGNLMGTLEHEIKLGSISKQEQLQLKQLTGAILSKRKHASKALKNSKKEIQKGEILSEGNMLHRDQLLTLKSKSSPKEYGQMKARKG